VKCRSSPFLTKTQVKLHLGTIVGLGVKIPRLAHLVGHGEALGTLISFFEAVSFPIPLPRHSASLLVLRKNQLKPFFIDLGKRNRLPVGKLDITVVLDEDN